MLDLGGNIDGEGIVQADTELVSDDGKATLRIPAGTTALTAEGTPLEQIELLPVIDPPAVPDGHIIGFAYDFKPDGATFSPPITLTLEYDPALLQAGFAEEDLVVAYYDTATGIWIILGGVVDPVSHTITVQISDFTIFAVLAIPTPVATPTPTPEVTPKPTATPAPVPTATPTPAPEEGAPTNVFLIIGPTLGALIVIALVIFFFTRRRQTQYID